MKYTFREKIIAQKIWGSNVRNFGLEILITAYKNFKGRNYTNCHKKVLVFGKLSNDTSSTKKYVGVHKILPFEVLTSTA